MRLSLSGATGGSGSSPGGGGGGGGTGTTSSEKPDDAAPAPGTAPSETMVRAKASGEDLQSPLNVIVGFSSMLADMDDLTPELRHRYAVRVREATTALQRAMARVDARDSSSAELSEDWQSSGTFAVAPESDPAAEPSAAGPPRVLIVDADEGSRELLAEYLRGRGYELILCGAAEDARRRAAERAPDLVLLDPEISGGDGYDLARTLKGKDASGFVPLIAVTSGADEATRIRALEAGAEQVVRKPINRHELRARVKSLLQLRAQQQALAAQNAQLRSLQRFKDETTAMLVHDLKSPLSAMMMNLDFALDDLPSGSSVDVRTALAESRAAGAKLFRMIANLLDIARSDDGRLVPRRSAVDLGPLFQRVIDEHAAEALARKVTVTSDVSLEGTIDVDPDILGRVMANLVENALRYTYAGGGIALAARSLDGAGSVELSVTNDGRPISAEWRALVFEKYVQVASGASANRGLGLYFCRVAVEAHGGRIELADEPATATRFRIVLPRA